MRIFILLLGLSSPARAGIAHEILELESAVDEVGPQRLALLDQILDEARALQLSPSARTPAEARAVLARIDQLLAQHGFAVPIGGKVELLRDALSPTQIGKSLAARLTGAPNQGRSHQGAVYHFFGSDNGAFLYLAIAEVAKLPLALMERPGADGPDSFQSSHYFVRWHLPGGTYDWNVLTGDEQHDVHYAFELNRQMTLGYVLWVRGNIWLRRGSYQQAGADLHAAATLFPGKAGIANSLAWLYATCPDPSIRDGNSAIAYALAASKLAPNNPSFQDTLAAAYASAGRFAEAEAAEEALVKHMAKSTRRDDYRQRAGLYHGGELYLASRHQDQVAEDFCDRFSEGDDSAPRCSPR